MRIRIANVGGLGTAAIIGQASGTGSTSGNRNVRLYQYESAGTTPADPDDSYDTTSAEYTTDFGDWEEDPDDLTGSGVLWVANGGTSLNANNVIVNRAWQLHVTIAEQYTPDFRDSSLYTDAAESDSQYVRSLLSNGSWGAWTSLADVVDDGWIDIISNQPAHVPISNGTRIFTLPGNGIDITYFEEIEVEILIHGTTSSGGAFTNIGAQMTAQERKRSGRWTDINDDSDILMKIGTYKVRAHDINGLSLVRSGGTSLNSSQTNKSSWHNYTQQWAYVTIDGLSRGRKIKDGIPVYDMPFTVVCGYTGDVVLACAGSIDEIVVNGSSSGEWVRVPVMQAEE